MADESKAYRRVQVAPQHRNFSAVAVWNTDRTDVLCFISVGHSFGLVAAVYNLNRQAVLATRYLRQVVGLQVRNYYDDRCGFSVIDIVDEEVAFARRFYRLSGC